MLHSIEIQQHPEPFIRTTLFFEGRRRHNQHSVNQLVAEAFIDIVGYAELVESHQGTGQLRTEYQPGLLGPLDLDNAHELARLRLGNLAQEVKLNSLWLLIISEVEVLKYSTSSFRFDKVAWRSFWQESTEQEIMQPIHGQAGRIVGLRAVCDE